MRFCSKCNAVLKEGENFCSNCGAKIEEEKSDYNDGYLDDDFDKDPIDFSAVHNFSGDSDPDNNIYSHSQHNADNANNNGAVVNINSHKNAPEKKEEPHIRKVCPNCNQPLNRGQSVCPYCGYDVSRYNDGFDSPIVDEYTPAPSPFTYTQTRNEKKKNSNAPVIVTAVIAVVAVIATIILLVAFMGNKNGSTQPTAPTADTAVTETQSETQTETETPTSEPTEPETDAPTEPPTEPQTEAPTEPQTEEPTLPETEPPTEPQSDITEPTVTGIDSL